MRTLGKALLVALAWFVACPAHAATGAEWLAGQAQADGSYSSASDFASSNQGTAEALTSLRAIGAISGPSNISLTFLSAGDATGQSQTTEALARRVIASIQAGTSPASLNSLTTELLNRQNTDGGFGALPGYDSSALDTTFALEALSALGSTSQSVGLAVGYLTSHQQSDGSWKDPAGGGDLDLTAMAMRAVWLYRNSFSVSSSIGNASTYLLAQRGSNGSWAETYQTAMALISILPTLIDKSAVSTSVSALSGAQRSDGSWSEDVYTTALALRAVALANAPNPDTASIHGRVIDSETKIPLGGASVTLRNGSQIYNFTTNADGSFSFQGLLAGNWNVSVTRDGYATSGTTVRVSAGDVVTLSDLSMPIASGTSNGIIKGIVVNASSGNPISGLTVSARGFTTQTLSDGSYEIPALAAGVVNVTVSGSGYATVTGAVPLNANDLGFFSPSMASGTAASGATVRGTVAGSNGAGVSITISGAATGSTTTDGVGNYSISGLSSGAATITAALGGYDTVQTTVTLADGSVTNFSPHLYSSNTSPPDANTSTIQGTLVDAASGHPIANANILLAAEPRAHIYWQWRFTGATPCCGSIYAIHLSEAQMRDVIGGPSMTAGGSATSNFCGDPSAAFDGNTETSWDTCWTGPTAVYLLAYQFPSASVVSEYDLMPQSSTSNGWAPTDWQLQYSDDGVTWYDADARVAQQMPGKPTFTSFIAGKVVQTDANGRFTISGLTRDLEHFSASVANYQSGKFAASMQPLQTLDVGSIAIKQTGVSLLQPDLVVTKIDARTEVQTDPQTLSISGNVVATIRNQGTSAITSAPYLAAFFDSNASCSLDATDSTFGEIRAGASVADLQPGQSATIRIPISGHALFRDAPISVMVDSRGDVLELDETNNVSGSSSGCALAPPTVMQAVQKWTYQADGRDTSVVMTPVVAPIIDTNGDGKVDSYDTPMIVLTSGPSLPDNNWGRLRILDGKTRIQRFASAIGLRAAGQLAVGDLDGDGKPEIVGYAFHPVSNVSNRTGVVAFNSDATVKWWNDTIAVGHGYVYDGPSLADLDGDGDVEVIADTYVLNSDGSVRWRNTNGYYAGGFPAAADLFGDGKQEVIWGASVFDANGNQLWRNDTVGDGFVAVGKFAPNTPGGQIVIAGNSVLTILDNSGQIICRAGVQNGITVPTVGDLDGDGLPEIGALINYGSQYRVFNSDCSTKWTATVGDGSFVTSATFYDFLGDGRREVVFRDENYIHIFSPDGVELQSFHIGSTTAGENPVVADIDGDGHADLVVPGETLVGYQDQNNTWPQTRKIWNQHEYRVTNVNDDGSIPRVEPANWQTLNTYRVNDEGVVDLSAALLRLADHGASQPVTLSVRIGNPGTYAASQLAVAFYRGNPSTGGIELARTTVAALGAGQYADLSVDVAPPFDNTAIYAVIDPDHHFAELDEANNVVSRTPCDDATLTSLSEFTDESSYGANAPVVLTATVGSAGALPVCPIVGQSVRDAADDAAANFGETQLGPIASGSAVVDTKQWNTGALRAGIYSAHAAARRADGLLLAQTSASFNINASNVDGGAGATASLRISTNKQTYSSTDQVSIDGLAQDLTSNVSISGAVMHVTVLSPSSQVVAVQDIALGEMAPGAVIERVVTQALTGAAQGIYTVQGLLKDGSGATIASASAVYSVAEDISSAITGSVAAQSATVNEGVSNICTDSIFNRGTVGQSLVLQRAVVRLDQTASVNPTLANLSLASGETQTLSRSVDTGPMQGGDYACTLEVRIGTNPDKWKSLGSARFHVVPETLSLTAAAATDKPIYDTTDHATITLSAHSNMSYRAAQGTSFHVEVTAPGQIVVFSQDVPVSDVAPGQTVPVSTVDAFTNAAEGNYAVHAVLRSTAGATLATADTGFEVRRAFAISGSVAVQATTVNQGTTDVCTDMLANASVHPVAGLQIRQTLLRTDQSATIGSTTSNVDVPANSSITLTRTIQTNSFDGGDYKCVLEYFKDSWQPAGEASFHVTAEPISATSAVASDKATYDSSDHAVLTLTAHSNMQYRTLKQAVHHIEISKPDGSSAFSSDVNLADLAPTQSIQSPVNYDFADVAEGTYTVKAQLKDQNGQTLASSQTTYQVKKSIARALSGTVAALNATVHQRDPQTCTDTLINGSTSPIASLQVRQSLLRTDVSPVQTVSSSDTTQDVPANGNKVMSRDISTTNMQVGSYACVLQALVDNQWKELDRASFSVVPAWVKLISGLSIGNRGRLLVLMDGQDTRTGGGLLCDNGLVGMQLEAVFDPPLTPSAVVNVSLKKGLLLLDAESTSVGAFDGELNLNLTNQNVNLSIPYLSVDNLLIKLTGNNLQGTLGNNYNILVTVVDASRNLSFQTGMIDLTCRSLYSIGGALNNVFNIVGLGAPIAGTPLNPGLDEGGLGDGVDLHSAAQQRTFLESLLQSEGWSYKVVTSHSEFADEFRTGNYSAYALLSEYEVLDEQVQKELREAVYRGDGLLVAGRHDIRNHILDSALGVAFKGHHGAPQGVQLLQSDVFTPGQAYFGQTGSTQWVQRVRTTGATKIGQLITAPGTPSASPNDSVVSEYVYRNGKSVEATFDLLAESELAGAATIMADVLKKPLTYIHPPQSMPKAGRAAPVRFTLSNQGVATHGKVTFHSTPAPGSYIIATSAGSLANGQVTWDYTLGVNETKTIDLWVSLPKAPLQATVIADVQSQDGTNTYDEGTFNLPVDAQVLPGLDQAITDLQAYVASLPTNILGQLIDPIFGTPPAKKARDYLISARNHLNGGDVVTALSELTAATDELMHDSSSQIPPIRLKVDEAILEVGQLQ